MPYIWDIIYVIVYTANIFDQGWQVFFRKESDGIFSF